jgi:hypothetical protein
MDEPEPAAEEQREGDGTRQQGQGQKQAATAPRRHQPIVFPDSGPPADAPREAGSTGDGDGAAKRPGLGPLQPAAAAQPRGAASPQKQQGQATKQRQGQQQPQQPQQQGSKGQQQQKLQQQGGKVQQQQQNPQQQRPTRYFLIKSASLDNFLLSRKQGVWATQAHNEAKLDEAFAQGDVMLVMSVNNTGGQPPKGGVGAGRGAARRRRQPRRPRPAGQARS